MEVYPMFKNFTACIKYSSRTTNNTAKLISMGKIMKVERSTKAN